MPLRGEGSCGGGGAPRDSAGSGATEEGLTSRGGRPRAEGLLFLHGLESNPGSSLQTEEEAGLPEALSKADNNSALSLTLSQLSCKQVGDGERNAEW